MTREEQIRISSVDNADRRIKEIPNLYFAINAIADYDNGLTQGFTDGVNWADENPKDGLVSIDKVCEWISDAYLYGVLDFKNCDAIINDFKQAMEE